MANKLFIFDWDGTLIDSTYQITSSLQRAFQALGLTPPSDEQARWVIGMSLNNALYHLAPNLPEDLIPDFIDQYKQFYFHPENHTKLFDGVREMLTDLKSKGALLAIATGKSRYGLNSVLEEQGLQHFFHCTKTADETASKPNPLMLEEILLELNIPVTEAMMIGDTSHDIRMAQQLHMYNIGISHGAHDLHELQDCHANEIVSNIPELHQRLLAQFDTT